MKRTKRIFAILLVVVVVLSLFVACDNSAVDEPEQTNADSSVESGPRRIVVGINSNIETLAPFSMVANGIGMVKECFWEYLANRGEDGSLEPQLAKGWTVEEDGYVYLVELYDYIYDSKGNHITADDVIFCYETYKATGLSMGLTRMESIEKIDDYNLKITANKNTVGVDFNLLWNVPIVSQAEYEASGDEMGSMTIGTGPYTIEEFVSGSNIIVKKRDDYWQTDESLVANLSKANVDEIEYVSILEASQMGIALETGAIDIAEQIAQSTGSRFLDDPNYDQFLKTASLGFQMYFSGDAHSPLADNKELRQAILYAIDVQGIIDAVYSGYGTQQYTLGPDTAVGFQESWRTEDYYSYNPEKAKELLAQAGYEPGELKIQFLTITMDQWEKCAQVIQGYLLAVGIDVEILAYEGALYGSYYNDGQYYDIVLNNTTGDYISALWASKLGQENYGGVTCSSIKDDTLEQLIQNCIYPNNFSDESIIECHEYIKEMAYCYGIAAQDNFNFARKEIGMSNPVYDGLTFLYIPGSTFDFE